MDLVLLWLWHRPAAVAMIQTLAWGVPFATGVDLKKRKKKKKETKKTSFNATKGRHLGLLSCVLMKTKK